jgi:hypothetical protein
MQSIIVPLKWGAGDHLIIRFLILSNKFVMENSHEIVAIIENHPYEKC